MVQLSSKTTNSVIDQKIIVEISRNEDLVADYILRLTKHLEMYDDSVIPLVYFAGRPPCQAFCHAQKMGLVKNVRKLSMANQVSIFQLVADDHCHREFVVMEGRNHPSAHYYSTNECRIEFRDTIGIIKGIAKSLKEKNGDLDLITEVKLDDDICKSTGMSPEQLQARKESNIFLTKMLNNCDD